MTCSRCQRTIDAVLDRPRVPAVAGPGAQDALRVLHEADPNIVVVLAGGAVDPEFDIALIGRR